MSVTIIAGSFVEADALATGAFVLGLEKGMELISKYGQAEAVFVTIDKKVYVTDGLPEIFQFVDEGNEYTYEIKC